MMQAELFASNAAGPILDRSQAVRFWIPGIPQQKGSTVSFRHPRTGAIITKSANAKLAPWESAVRCAAFAAWLGPPADGPVSIEARFCFIRPASVSAKRRPHHTIRPDVDKLLRGLLDGLSGIVFADDCQVVCAIAEKCYHHTPGAAVTVTRR